MIYLVLEGRIGNQLFMYAAACAFREQVAGEEKIVIDDSGVKRWNWTNSLKQYPLKNVEFVHERHTIMNRLSLVQKILWKFYYKFILPKPYMRKYKLEKQLRPLYNFFGMAICENGYLPMKLHKRKAMMVYGYFQSDRYFSNIKREILNEFSLKKQMHLINTYPGIELIKKRNSVCVSIKIEHNVDNDLYGVCKRDYWKRAITYMIGHVQDPLFFICSDNVDYVKKNIIDCDRYDVIFQSKDFPVHITLAVMGMCKHYIIGNTSFGWWAQYFSENPDKIVLAPSKWMLTEIPVDIYQEGWKLIEV